MNSFTFGLNGRRYRQGGTQRRTGISGR